MTRQEQIDQWSKPYGRQIFLETIVRKWHSEGWR